ncbi:hypothetical protein O9929_01750 [Vibrio lentus]|nr:hypothetical protein [Vibrio lentus]
MGKTNIPVWIFYSRYGWLFGMPRPLLRCKGVQARLPNAEDVTQLLCQTSRIEFDLIQSLVPESSCCCRPCNESRCIWICIRSRSFAGQNGKDKPKKSGSSKRVIQELDNAPQNVSGC